MKVVVIGATGTLGRAYVEAIEGDAQGDVICPR